MFCSIDRLQRNLASPTAFYVQALARYSDGLFIAYPHLYPQHLKQQFALSREADEMEYSSLPKCFIVAQSSKEAMG